MIYNTDDCYDSVFYNNIDEISVEYSYYGYTYRTNVISIIDVPYHNYKFVKGEV